MTHTILLTGAHGFIGQHVTRELLARGCKLKLVERSRPVRTSRFPHQDQVQTVKTPDLFTEPAEWWTETCHGVDSILHLAWIATPGSYLTSALNTDCLSGTLNMAKGALRAGVRRFIGIGSCAEYHLGNQPLRSDSPLDPQTPYACAKTATWYALSKWLPEAGMEFAWARLFYLYGQGEHPDRLIPFVHRKLSKGEEVELTSGHQVRDYMEVTSAAQMLAELTLSSDRVPSTYVRGRASLYAHWSKQ